MRVVQTLHRRQRRIVPAIALAIVAAACAGSDDAGDETTAPEITLSPTSAPTTEVEVTTTEQVTTTSTTTTTTSTTTTSTTTTEPPPTTEPAPTTPEFVLGNDGLGSAAFGAEPEGVVSFVSSFFGEPTNDTGWVDPFSIGPCGGTELRQVTWGGLLLEFSDSSNIAQGRRHLYAYYYGTGAPGGTTPPGLATPEGISVGSTVAELLDAYPDVDLRSADDFIGPNFIINDNLRGEMTGLADTDTITLIVGGLPCSG